MPYPSPTLHELRIRMASTTRAILLGRFDGLRQRFALNELNKATKRVLPLAHNRGAVIFVHSVHAMPLLTRTSLQKTTQPPGYRPKPVTNRCSITTRKAELKLAQIVNRLNAQLFNSLIDLQRGGKTGATHSASLYMG